MLEEESAANLKLMQNQIAENKEGIRAFQAIAKSLQKSNTGNMASLIAMCKNFESQLSQSNEHLAATTHNGEHPKTSALLMTEVRNIIDLFSEVQSKSNQSAAKI